MREMGITLFDENIRIEHGYNKYTLFIEDSQHCRNAIVNALIDVGGFEVLFGSMCDNEIADFEEALKREIALRKSPI